MDTGKTFDEKNISPRFDRKLKKFGAQPMAKIGENDAIQVEHTQTPPRAEIKGHGHGFRIRRVKDDDLALNPKTIGLPVYMNIWSR